MLLLLCAAATAVHARQDNASTASTNLLADATKEEQVAALSLEMTNTYGKVLKIVNQPIHAYTRTPEMRVRVYPYWFHDGASTPDFANVDIRQTQELTYSNSYVASELNPNMVFVGTELEYNSNTKLFYTNRNIPKHKLSQAEMVQINDLYRVIARCQDQIAKLSPPPPATAATAAATDADETKEVVVPGQSFEAIRKNPPANPVLFMRSIAIGRPRASRRNPARSEKVRLTPRSIIFFRSLSRLCVFALNKNLRTVVGSWNF